MIKVEGQHNLYRNESGAIVNADWAAYERAKKKKKEKQRVDNLENRLGRIEELLENLINVIETN